MCARGQIKQMVPQWPFERRARLGKEFDNKTNFSIINLNCFLEQMLVRKSVVDLQSIALSVLYRNRK